MKHGYLFCCNETYLKYEFKGCSKIDADCEIKNHSCPEHHEFMKQRGNEKRRANNAKHKVTKRKNLILMFVLL